jgi:hypothetical protein
LGLGGTEEARKVKAGVTRSQADLFVRRPPRVARTMRMTRTWLAAATELCASHI